MTDKNKIMIDKTYPPRLKIIGKIVPKTYF